MLVCAARDREPASCGENQHSHREAAGTLQPNAQKIVQEGLTMDIAIGLIAATALEVYSLLLPNLASWQTLRETRITKVLARSHP